MPWLRAVSIASFTPGPFGVIKMPLSPRATAASMALTCPSSSPSLAPAALVRVTPFFAAASSAPFCMEIQNGLLLSLVIKVTAISPPPPPPLAEPSASGVPVLPPPPQAANVSDAAAVNATAAARRTPRRLGGRYFIDDPSLELRTADYDNGVKLILNC